MNFWQAIRPRMRVFGEGTTNGLLAAMLAVDLLVVGLLGAVTYMDYAAQREKAALIGENLSRVLDQNLLGMLEKIDLTLMASVEEVEDQTWAGTLGESTLKDILSRQEKHIPEIAGLNVSDPSGKIIGSSLEIGGIGVDISDRVPFREHRDHPNSGLIVSEPALGRVFLIPTVVFSRAYRAPDGSFGGVVTASVAMKSMLRILSTVDVGPKGNASLWGRKMGLLVRYSPQPTAAAVNPLPPPRLAGLMAADSTPTAFYMPTDFDGVERMEFYRRVSGWPLYLLVGVAADDYLSEWRSLAAILGGIAFLFVVASLVTFRALTRMFFTVKTSETRLDMALAVSRQGWFEMFVQEGRIDHSRECARMLGFAPAAFRTDMQGWLRDIHPEDRNPVRRAFDDCLTSDTSMDVDYRCRTADNTWRWMRTVGKVVERTPSGEAVRLLGTHVDISERKESERMIKELAYFDVLTGLPNRRLLMDRMGQALLACNRSARFGGILFVDMDNFKTLNDSLGHAQGDLLLQEVAERLTAGVRAGDTIARLGGDEFVVVLEELNDTEAEAISQATAIARKILSALSQPYLFQSRDFHYTASIGVDVFGPGTGLSPDDLLKRADIAMYGAKAMGKNCLKLFSPSMQTAIEARSSLEEDLRHALRHDQFALYYQPQIEENRVIGAEALIRWRHPEKGIVPPSEFIPVAEETGLIIPLGDWVLRTACERIVAWKDNPATRDLFVSVNVSAIQCHQQNFVTSVIAAIERSGADPRRLKIELTESALIGNTADIRKKMQALRALGITFSLDDFGTGYSSLSYLRHLPLDQLKIDQSFISGIEHDASKGAIARAIILLAQTLGLSVIAEGVENRAQRDFLFGIGCPAYQGYLFSPPVASPDFSDFLNAWPASDLAAAPHRPGETAPLAPQ